MGNKDSSIPRWEKPTSNKRTKSNWKEWVVLVGKCAQNLQILKAIMTEGETKRETSAARGVFGQTEGLRKRKREKYLRGRGISTCMILIDLRFVV